MTRFLLVRHGRSEWNLQGRWQGWADPPLADEGRTQAAAAAGALTQIHPPVLASDLARAVETARVIAARLGLGEVQPDPAFREIDVGDWTGLTRVEIEQRWPGALEGWRSGILERPPGGESRREMVGRVLEAIERHRRAHPGATLLVVTHAGVIRGVEEHLGAYEQATTGNLAGRWLEAASPLRAGERVVLAGPPAD